MTQVNIFTKVRSKIEKKLELQKVGGGRRLGSVFYYCIK